MADVEPLGHVVKRKRYERSYGRSAHLRMSERLANQLIANAIALAVRRHKKLSQEPKFSANPAPGEANDFSVLFSHPQARGIIRKRECLEVWRSRRRHLAEASPFSEVVDTANYDLVSSLQVVQSSRSAYDRHLFESPNCTLDQDYRVRLQRPGSSLNFFLVHRGCPVRAMSGLPLEEAKKQRANTDALGHETSPPVTRHQLSRRAVRASPVRYAPKI
jgi:hypothetical protein